MRLSLMENVILDPRAFGFLIHQSRAKEKSSGVENGQVLVLITLMV